MISCDNPKGLIPGIYSKETLLHFDNNDNTILDNSLQPDCDSISSYSDGRHIFEKQF